MDNLIKEIKLDNWWQYEYFINNLPNPDSFIYRGQSNDFSRPTFTSWQLVSSFKRRYHSCLIKFKYFAEKLDPKICRYFFRNYKVDIIEKLGDSSSIDKLYFFQHYGIPTCLIDFTHDPLIALYFAMAEVSEPDTKSYDNESNPKFYPNDCYLTIYQLNHERLKTVFNVKDIENTSFNTDRYLSYRITINYNDYYLGLDLTPESKINSSLVENFNLKKQKSVFLLFDDTETYQTKSFEDFINEWCEDKTIENPEPILTKYLIPYNSVFESRDSNSPQSTSLFHYLIKKGISGCFLFNDLQGIKYDFNHVN